MRKVSVLRTIIGLAAVAVGVVGVTFSGWRIDPSGAPELIRKVRIPGATLSIDWHPDSNVVALGGFAGMLIVVDVTTGTVRDLKQDREVRAVKFSPDGRLLAVGKSFNKAKEAFVKILETGSYIPRYEITAPEAGPESRFNSVANITSLSFDSATRLLAVGGYQSQSEAAVYRLDHLATGPVLVIPTNRTTADFVAFQPNTDVLVIGGVGGKIQRYSVTSGTLLREIQAFDHHWWIKSLFFDRTGRALYAASNTGMEHGYLDRRTGQWHDEKNQSPLKVWNAETYEMMKRIALPDGGVNAVAATPDGKTAIIGTNVGKVALIEMSSGETKWIPATHKTAIKVAVSPDGKLLATVGMGARYLYIWKLVDSKH